jgi:hypothetical protein
MTSAKREDRGRCRIPLHIPLQFRCSSSAHSPAIPLLAGVGEFSRKLLILAGF